jgi:phosphoglycerol transferase MdoB-like AlkP superfamily enzyme
LYLFFALFIVVSLLTRTVLLVKSLPMLNCNLWLLSKIYAIGLFYDIVTMLYFSIPFTLYLTIVPTKIYQAKLNKITVFFISSVVVYLIIFTSVAEYFFFDEFNVRFNFIAVDYLIYTNELIKNIRESYGLPLLMSAIGVISLSLLLSLRKFFYSSFNDKTGFRLRVRKGLIFLVLPFLSFLFVDLSFTKMSNNTYANELSANGIYNFFAAFRNNQIDYESFYAAKNNKFVFEKLRELLKEPNSTFATTDIFDITRHIKNYGKERRLNVVVIIVESLSAEYLGVFGNRSAITPNIDQLAHESLLFTNMHATGTRTDRGLESITLSIPPTPGRSMLKRPGNENMFSWGSIMRSRGYDTKFLYGGYGYFDNMNYFFGHNGFETIDRHDITKDNIHFENAWGICDEDLFHKALTEFNTSYKNNKPFFAEIMTTSNHRPYTYPENKVDIPSHTGRNGAVKYTDYAIGKFIKDAKKEPWFKNTIFVIVADHCASSAGKTKLPEKKYQIPLLIYSPAHIIPGRIDKLASQIDLAPTVLGLLNFSYQSRFFGKDLLKLQKEEERALIGTYEKLGYINGDRLLVLDVNKENTMYRFDRYTGKAEQISMDLTMLDEAISYYQSASYLYKHKGLNETPH